MRNQGGVTPQTSVLPPATAVKHKVKCQEAKIVNVKGKAWFLKESRVKHIADIIPYTQKFLWYKIFAEQQVNRIFVIIFSRITGPKFSHFLLVSISYHMTKIMLQNILLTLRLLDQVLCQVPCHGQPSILWMELGVYCKSVYVQDNSSPLCYKSHEYFLGPVIVHWIVPPHLKNNVHVHEMVQEMWPMIMLLAILPVEQVSGDLLHSCLHIHSSLFP